MLIEGRKGAPASKIADGVQVAARITDTGGMAVTNMHGAYSDASIRGRMFAVCNATGGIAPGTALSTTPPIALWNPPGSGMNLVILRTSIGYVSGTLGAGCVYYGLTVGQASIPSTGTELTPVNCCLGLPRGQGRAFTGSTIVLAPVIIRPVYTLGAALASTVLFSTPMYDIVDGEITVPENTVFAMQGVTATGSAPLVSFGITWEEVPNK